MSFASACLVRGRVAGGPAGLAAMTPPATSRASSDSSRASTASRVASSAITRPGTPWRESRADRNRVAIDAVKIAITATPTNMKTTPIARPASVTGV